MPPNMSPLTRSIGKILKPLTKSEANRAMKAAVEYLRPELDREGQSRFRTLGAQLYLSRPRGKERLARLVEVLLVDYLNRRQIRVVVGQNRVAEVRELDWQPAFSAEEIAEAEALAAKDPRLRAVARSRRVFTSPFSPGGNSPRERRIGLRYLLREKQGARLVAEAEVDLMDQVLIAAVTHGAQGGSHG